MPSPTGFIFCPSCSFCLLGLFFFSILMYNCSSFFFSQCVLPWSPVAAPLSSSPAQVLMSLGHPSLCLWLSHSLCRSLHHPSWPKTAQDVTVGNFLTGSSDRCFISTLFYQTSHLHVIPAWNSSLGFHDTVVFLPVPLKLSLLCLLDGRSLHSALRLTFLRVPLGAL